MPWFTHKRITQSGVGYIFRCQDPANISVKLKEIQWRNPSTSKALGSPSDSPSPSAILIPDSSEGTRIGRAVGVTCRPGTRLIIDFLDEEDDNERTAGSGADGGSQSPDDLAPVHIDAIEYAQMRLMKTPLSAANHKFKVVGIATPGSDQGQNFEGEEQNARECGGRYQSWRPTAPCRRRKTPRSPRPSSNPFGSMGVNWEDYAMGEPPNHGAGPDPDENVRPTGADRQPPLGWLPYHDDLKIAMTYMLHDFEDFREDGDGKALEGELNPDDLLRYVNGNDPYVDTWTGAYLIRRPQEMGGNGKEVGLGVEQRQHVGSEKGGVKPGAALNAENDGLVANTGKQQSVGESGCVDALTNGNARPNDNGGTEGGCSDDQNGLPLSHVNDPRRRYLGDTTKKKSGSKKS